MDRQTAEARKDMVMNFSTILRTNAICTRQDLTPPPMLKRLRAVVQGYERVIRKKNYWALHTEDKNVHKHNKAR